MENWKKSLWRATGFIQSTEYTVEQFKINFKKPKHTHKRGKRKYIYIYIYIYKIKRKKSTLEASSLDNGTSVRSSPWQFAKGKQMGSWCLLGAWMEDWYILLKNHLGKVKVDSQSHSEEHRSSGWLWLDVWRWELAQQWPYQGHGRGPSVLWPYKYKRYLTVCSWFHCLNICDFISTV